MSKCGVFSPAASDDELAFIPAEIEGALEHRNKKGELIGRCAA